MFPPSKTICSIKKAVRSSFGFIPIDTEETGRDASRHLVGPDGNFTSLSIKIERITGSRANFDDEKE